MRKRAFMNVHIKKTRLLPTMVCTVFTPKTLIVLAFIWSIWILRFHIAHKLSHIYTFTPIKRAKTYFEAKEKLNGVFRNNRTGNGTTKDSFPSSHDQKGDRLEKHLESADAVSLVRTKELQNLGNSFKDSAISQDKVLMQLSDAQEPVRLVSSGEKSVARKPTITIPKSFNTSFVEQLYEIPDGKNTGSKDKTQIKINGKNEMPAVASRSKKPKVHKHSTVISKQIHPNQNKNIEDKKFSFFPPSKDELGMFAAYVPKHSTVELLDRPIINPHNYSFIHNQEKLCHNNDIDILFVAPSAPNNTQRRSNFRKSEMYQRVDSLELKARFLFFIGKPKVNDGENLVQQKINIEADKYSDIIQQDFIDIYKNIRLKAVAMLKWAVMYCSNAKYVIRTDDDASVNVINLVATIHKIGSQMDNFIIGHVRTNRSSIRNKHSKYYLSLAEYPHKTFPAFAIGGLLGYPMKTVQLLYESSLRVPAVWLDDVYITGICRLTINATLIYHPLFDFKHLNT